MIKKQERAARSIGRNLPISAKQCIEICAFLKGKRLDAAIATMKRVIQKKQAVPFRRFVNGLGHKPGNMAAGRYPVKSSGEILKLLENAKANATNQGLTGELRITHMAANRASNPMRNRLKERNAFKRTHVEVVVTEQSEPSAKTAKE